MPCFAEHFPLLSSRHNVTAATTEVVNAPLIPIAPTVGTQHHAITDLDIMPHVQTITVAPPDVPVSAISVQTTIKTMV